MTRVSDDLFGYLIILLTLFLAFVFSILALPEMFPSVFGYLRPSWVFLVLIYWILALPNRIGIMWAFFTGLLVDVMTGNLLGVHSLAFSLSAYLVMLQYQRIRMFSVVRQMLVILLLTFITQLLQLWVNSLTSIVDFGFFYFMPTIASALLWPLIYLGLRSVRRAAGLR